MNQFISLSVLLTTIEAHGASGGDIPWYAVGSQVLNFSLFAMILIFVLRNKVRDLFVQRERDYTQFFREAEMKRDEAERHKLKIVQRLKTLEGEAEVASQKAQSEAEDLKNKIVSEAHSLSKRYLEEAERTAQYEFDKAVSELREELLSGALDGAESLLKERVDISTQRKLNGEFTKKIQLVKP